MWHSQYAILDSWFKDSSQFSLLQFVGWKGFVVSTLLLDLGKGMFLRGLLSFGVLSALLLTMPIWECVVSRILTSSLLWMKWMSWGRFVHAALPLKILIGQMVWKSLAGSFGKLEGMVRDSIVELECAILEEHIPVTIGDNDGESSDIDEGTCTDDFDVGSGSGYESGLSLTDDIDSEEDELTEDDVDSEYDEYDDDY